MGIGAFEIFINRLSGQSAEGQILSLETALERAAKYCDRLETASLDFTCLEEIKEKQWVAGRETSSLPGGASLSSAFYTQNTYVYDYQLVRKGGRISETRTLIEENGIKKDEKNAQLKTDVFEHRYVIFGPIGLVGRKWQARHDYKIVKQETFRKQRCLVVEALPKDQGEAGHLYGRLWLRVPDAAVLKIEWNQASMGNIKAVEGFARRRNWRPEIVFASEYNYEKNGLRFPSRYAVTEGYYDQSSLNYIQRSETVVTYDKYKFFVVETNVTY